MKETKTTIATIEDQREFCKLFKIKIPMHEHFDYYIDLLYRSGSFPDVYKMIDQFNEYVDLVRDQTDYGSVVKYKLDYALPTLTEYVKSTYAYKSLIRVANDFMHDQTFESKDRRKEFIGKPCLSIDIKQANFSALKYMDNQNSPEFEHDWNRFVCEKNVYSFLGNSKSFRQYVFGNCNPKAFAKIQKSIISELKDFLQKKDVSKKGVSSREKDIFITEDRFVFVSHDEIILSISWDELEISDISDAVEEFAKSKGLEFHIKPFVEHQKENGVIVREVYDLETGGSTDELFGVDGSRTWIELKKHILNEEIDQRDLLFKQNNSIAQWVLDDNNDIVRTITVKKKGFLEIIDEKIPEMDDDMKAKVVNLAVNYFGGI